MREIKFEFMYSDGKYFTKATMTLDELLNSNEDDIYEKATDRYALYSGLENFELIAKRQYTGLKDSKGVEIYEGDIFKAPHNFGPAGFHERIASVALDKFLGYQWNYWDIEQIEVIGNIYENPEQLETT